jgi:hypothetical protein
VDEPGHQVERVSDIRAKDMIGVAADSYRYGVVMMNFDFIGCCAGPRSFGPHFGRQMARRDVGSWR